MSKSESQFDVLVLGEHPCAYLAAALLREKTKLRVLHATIPGEPSPDRFTLINPEFFAMHPLLAPLQKKLDLTPVYGMRFLCDEQGTRSEHCGKSPIAYIANYRDVRAAMIELAQSEGVEMISPDSMAIESLDEKGLELSINHAPVRPKVLVLAGRLESLQEKMLGLPDSWGQDVVHRYTFVKMPVADAINFGEKPVVPMSLDLRGMLCWAWAMPHGERVQIAVEQPVETLSRIRPNELLRHWVDVLRQHGVLKAGCDVPFDQAETVDLPFGGALAHEGVANRTILIGPAGGFYSATGEDIYPNCWSALFAAEVIRKALKERHLQDALQPYRQRWRTTLGDYMRGPQQNLRYLLPLIYRNQVMTTRLAEAILLGKSVVR